MKKTIALTDQELNIVLYGLQKLPWETSNEVIRNIAEQLKAQSIVKEEIKEDK